MIYETGTWREFAERYQKFAPELRFELDSQQCALVIIDAQRKAFDPHATRGMGKTLPERYPDLAEPYFASLENTVMPNLVSLLEFFRTHDLPVIYTTAGPLLASGEDLPYSFRVQYKSAHGMDNESGIHTGTPEYAIVDELRPRPEEPVINKVTRSAFIGTGLANMLRNMGVNQVLLGGVATHACVESTGRSASDLGFQVVVVEDACLSQFPLLHDATLVNFLMSMGRVITTHDVLRELAKPPN
ncbi:MAG TPA: hypothetical protein DIT46_08255 [Gemmatimonadetes bacterium]|nr:hypothetical protein [Gemmatimonadota bacterium]